MCRFKYLGEIYEQKMSSQETFYPSLFDDSTFCQNLWCCELIFPKAVLIFPKKFLNFKLNRIKKQGIMNLCSYSSKSVASVVLSDSEVAYHGEEEDATFRPFLSFYFVYKQCCIIEGECRKMFLSFILQEEFVSACSFSAYNFFSTASSSSSVNCPNLMSSWL